MESKIIKAKWRAVCRAEACDAEARTAGFCPRHYQQIRRHGRLTPEREYRKRSGDCRVIDCNEGQIAKGYCFRHYQQVRRYGRLTPERERVYVLQDLPGTELPRAAFIAGFLQKALYERVLPALGGWRGAPQRLALL